MLLPCSWIIEGRVDKALRAASRRGQHWFRTGTIPVESEQQQLAIERGLAHFGAGALQAVP
jgi:hypothetical protein